MQCIVCNKKTTLKCSKCNNIYYCSKICQRNNWKLHKYTCSENIIIKKSNNKGFGIFSKKKFSIGDIIHIESPIFIYDIKNYNIEYERLNTYKKKILNTFSNVHSKNNNLFGILKTNGIPIKEYNMFITKGGIFPLISKINHECDPNAVFYWNNNEKKEYLFSLKNINIDDEINVCYIERFSPYKERQQILYNTFKFVCTCNFCKKNIENKETDIKLLKIQKLIDNVLIIGPTNPQRGYEMVLDTINYIKEIGLDSSVNLYSRYYDLYQFVIHTKISKNKIKIYIEKLLKYCTLCRGKTADETIKIINILENIKKK